MVVSILFIFYCLLCDCPKLYLFVNNTQQDAYTMKVLMKKSGSWRWLILCQS
jgi:uncharacterized membrane protein YesL